MEETRFREALCARLLFGAPPPRSKRRAQLAREAAIDHRVSGDEVRPIESGANLLRGNKLIVEDRASDVFGRKGAHRTCNKATSMRCRRCAQFRFTAPPKLRRGPLNPFGGTRSQVGRSVGACKSGAARESIAPLAAADKCEHSLWARAINRPSSDAAREVRPAERCSAGLFRTVVWNLFRAARSGQGRHLDGSAPLTSCQSSAHAAPACQNGETNRVGARGPRTDLLASCCFVADGLFYLAIVRARANCNLISPVEPTEFTSRARSSAMCDCAPVRSL